MYDDPFSDNSVSLADVVAWDAWVEDVCLRPGGDSQEVPACGSVRLQFVSYASGGCDHDVHSLEYLPEVDPDEAVHRLGGQLHGGVVLRRVVHHRMERHYRWDPKRVAADQCADRHRRNTMDVDNIWVYLPENLDFVRRIDGNIVSLIALELDSGEVVDAFLPVFGFRLGGYDEDLMSEGLERFLDDADGCDHAISGGEPAVRHHRYSHDWLKAIIVFNCTR